MFTNVFAKGITNEEGYIVSEKVGTLVPGNTEVAHAVAHATQLLARTSLDERFIELNFELLPFDVLIQHNQIAEHIVFQNIGFIQEEIAKDVVSGDMELLMNFLSFSYPYYINEAVIGRCVSALAQFANTVHDDVLEEFTTLVNVYVDVVSKEFVMNNINDFTYNLLTAALKRKDITRAELMDRLDDIMLSEIMTWMFEFVDLTEEEEAEVVDYRTKENKQLLIDLFLVKSKEA